MWQKKDIVNEFQRLGKRITKQRMVILDVILEQNWTDCKEVYYEAVQRDSTVGLSTVYRTIRMLEEMGVLKRRRGKRGYRPGVPRKERSQTDRKRERKMLFLQCVINAEKTAGHRVRNDCKLSENDKIFQHKIL